MPQFLSVWHSCQCFTSSSTSWHHPPPGSRASPQCFCAQATSLHFILYLTLFECQLLAELLAAPCQTWPPLIFLSPLSLPPTFVVIFPTFCSTHLITHLSFSFLCFSVSRWLYRNYLFPLSTPLCN